MKSIALYWSGGGSSIVNYGDGLSQYIVSRLSKRNVVYARPHRADLMAVGSILEKAIRSPWKHHMNFRRSSLAIWGTGATTSTQRRLPSYLHFASVRGPLTRDMLSLKPNIALGDPALLMRELLPIKEKRFRWGIVPHLSDWGAPSVISLQESIPNSVTIDLRNPDLEATTRLIASCELIISSSLHGLIIADAYSVPNVKISFNNRLIGGSRKFIDYGWSVSRFIEDVDASDTIRNMEQKAGHADPKTISMRIDESLAAFQQLNL